MTDALRLASSAGSPWPDRSAHIDPSGSIAWGEVSADQADGFAPDDSFDLDDLDPPDDDCGYGFGV